MQDKLIIKIAAEKDANAVAQILALAFGEFKEKYTSKAFEATVISPSEVKERMKKGLVWIATSDTEAMGTVSGKKQGASFYLQGMAVIPKGRNKQIGYKLLKTAEQYAKDQDCQDLILSTTPYLTKAIRLYQRFGFEIINEPPYEFFRTPLFNLMKRLK